jgi:hypothetical protein
MTTTNVGLFGAILCSLCVWGTARAEEPASAAEMRSLDEQVQEIKTDVLGIAAELTRLEEKLLYPSGTQCTRPAAWRRAARVHG